MPSGPLMYSCFTGPPKPSENEHTVKIISTRSVILLQIVMVSLVLQGRRNPLKNEHTVKFISTWSGILLQIVMVSPGTHLLKNYEFQSRTVKSQFKKQ